MMKMPLVILNEVKNLASIVTTQIGDARMTCDTVGKLQ